MAQINGKTGKNASYWRYFLVCTEILPDDYISTNTTKLKVDVYLGATSYSRAVRRKCICNSYSKCQWKRLYF